MKIPASLAFVIHAANQSMTRVKQRSALTFSAVDDVLVTLLHGSSFHGECLNIVSNLEYFSEY